MTDDRDMALPSDRAGRASPEPANILERFNRFVERGPNCWLWIGAPDSTGYGRFYRVRNKPERAHRVAMELAGRAMPVGTVVDHICRNRLCVNPDHLRSVSRHENVHENSNALAHLNSLKTRCPKGHPYIGENLIYRNCGRRMCRTCQNQAARDRRARNAK